MIVLTSDFSFSESADRSVLSSPFLTISSSGILRFLLDLRVGEPWVPPREATTPRRTDRPVRFSALSSWRVSWVRINLAFAILVSLAPQLLLPFPGFDFDFFLQEKRTSTDLAVLELTENRLIPLARTFLDTLRGAPPQNILHPFAFRSSGFPLSHLTYILRVALSSRPGCRDDFPSSSSVTPFGGLTPVSVPVAPFPLPSGATLYLEVHATCNGGLNFCFFFGLELTFLLILFTLRSTSFPSHKSARRR